MLLLIFPELGNRADNWSLIDHLPPPSPPAPLFFFYLKDAKACTCVCVCVCCSLPCVWLWYRACWWGFKGRAGRAGLAVFVPAGINASCKPGNEVRLQSSKSLLPSLPSLPGSLPPLVSLSVSFSHSHLSLLPPHSAQGCCCLLAWYGPLLL